jgi:O-antigen/teichoic acid export membrane protein
LTLSSIFYPLTSKFGNSENYKIELRKIFELLIFLVIPFTLAFFLFSKELIFVLFGEKYLKADLVLKIFSIFLIFKLLNGYFVSILNGLKEVGYLNKIYLVGALFNIIFDSLSIFLMNRKEEALYLISLATSSSWFLISLLAFIKLKSYFLKNFCFSCLKEKAIKLILANLVFLNFIWGLKIVLIKLNFNYWLIFGIEFIFSTSFYLLITKFLGLWPKILEDLFITILRELKKN